MKVPEHVRVNVTRDGLIVLDICKAQIFRANMVAARIWQGIVIDSKSKEEVIESIVKECGTTRDLVARDLEEFIEALKSKKLIVDA